MEQGSDPNAMSVAVAIVNYGTAEQVIAGLPTLQRELAPLPRRAIFIVDNASPGDDAARLSAHLETGGAGGGPDPEVRLIASTHNGGFAAGNNLAFEAIREMDWTPDAVLMLNPDAELRPGALQAMLEVLADRQKAGFVGPRLERADGTTWSGAFHFPSAATEFARAVGIELLLRRWSVVMPDSAVPVRADWITGAGMLTRWRTIEDLDGMDEEYFLYYEEVDFMRRAAEKGWETWHAPEAIVLHDEGTSTGLTAGKPRVGPMPQYWFESWRRYFSRNYSQKYMIYCAILKLMGTYLYIFHRKARGLPVFLPPNFPADFLRNTVFLEINNYFTYNVE